MALRLNTILGDRNRSAVLSTIVSKPGQDYDGIAETTGLSRTIVTRVVRALVHENVVRRDLMGDGHDVELGNFRLNERMAVVVGVDLGGTNCRLVAADGCGTALGRRLTRTPTGLAGPDLADWLAGEVYGLVSTVGRGADLGAVALGLPGAISSDGTEVVGSLNLPAIEGVAFTEMLRDAFSVPTVFDNDSNLALFGELQYGPIPGVDTTVLLVLGTGLSAAVALNGVIVVGGEGSLGEFGRLPLPGSNDRLRDFISGAGLVAYARQHGREADSAAELLRGRGADAGLLTQVRQALECLINVVALAYEPHAVLITGGFSESLDDQLFDELGRKVAESVGVRLSVRRASLGDDAGLLGALSVALGRYLWSIGVSPEDLETPLPTAAILSAFRECAPAPSPGSQLLAATVGYLA